MTYTLLAVIGIQTITIFYLIRFILKYFRLTIIELQEDLMANDDEFRQESP